MNWTSIRTWIGTLVRIVLGAVFLVAGWEKLHDPRAFLRAVRAYDATPEWLSKVIGYGLPVLEISIGLLLVAGVITRLAAVASGVLLIVFLIGIVEASARGFKLDCGCFGGGGTTTGGTHYMLDSLRDIGLLALAVFLVLWPMTRVSVDEFLARNDNVAMPSAKRMRTGQGQRKYNAVLEARKKEARTRTRFLSSALAILVVLISIVGIGVQANRAKIQGTLTATNASVKNGVVLGKAAKVTIDLFEDFQCPVCEQFHQSAGADIDSLILSGKAQVRFHMVAILDSSSNGNRYSSRAANASLCASDLSPEEFLRYHDYLYSTQKGNAIQPAEGSNGRTDTDLISYAQATGVSAADLTTLQSCVQSEQHKTLVLAITDDFSARGLTGTPTVLVNGKSVSNGASTKAGFDKAVLAADSTATAGATATAFPSIPTPAPTTSSTATTGATQPADTTAAATPTATP